MKRLNYLKIPISLKNKVIKLNDLGTNCSRLEQTCFKLRDEFKKVVRGKLASGQTYQLPINQMLQPSATAYY